MDYSQFLNISDELSLISVNVTLIIADLIICPDRKSGKGVLNTPLPIILLLLQTAFLFIAPHGFCSFENGHALECFGGMYQLTPMMTVVKSILNVGTIIVFLMAHEWMKRSENQIKQGEFYVLTLSTLLGMYFMISAGHFLMFFIGLELASIPMTALVAFSKKNQQSAEAAAKYILTALFSSGLLLYGISLLYGTCGTLYFNDIAPLLSDCNWMQ